MAPRDSSRKGSTKRAKRGRPAVPDAERARIIGAIADHMAGGKTVPAACQAEGINPSTLFRWTAEDEALRDVYARAREARAHTYAEQIIAVAEGLGPETKHRARAMAQAIAGEPDDAKADQILRALEANAVQRDRLRVDALKWLAAKTAPRDYGEQVKLDHGGTITVHVRREAAHRHAR